MQTSLFLVLENKTKAEQKQYKLLISVFVSISLRTLVPKVSWHAHSQGMRLLDCSVGSDISHGRFQRLEPLKTKV